ncbi:nitrilase family protein [Desulfofalx alkaliphila]|uniref:nitrilase family protein n=1 Tax=Desulfofalx alkaliphila TaxID=105483 RepID=UPI0004E1B502|nr:nitrilase family protein [Desulfofalx alkaliphila]
MQKTKIALVQMNAPFGEIESNLRKISNFIMEAHRQRVDIICFPELALMGYSRDQSHLHAEHIPGESSRYIVDLAQRYGITVLLGMAEKSTQANKPYITQLIAMPDGSYHKYRKTHLGGSEQPYFTAGDAIPVFKTGKAVFGVQICWDLHFPEVSTIMSLQGAEIIFAPHASPCVAGDRKELWLKYLTARAYDNAVYLAACNLIGNSSQGHPFAGGNLVIDPKGNVIADDFNNEEGMLVVDLDEGLINKIRYERTTSMRYIFHLDARRPDLYEKYKGILKEGHRLG